MISLWLHWFLAHDIPLTAMIPGSWHTFDCIDSWLMNSFWLHWFLAHEISLTTLIPGPWNLFDYFDSCSYPFDYIDSWLMTSLWLHWFPAHDIPLTTLIPDSWQPFDYIDSWLMISLCTPGNVVRGNQSYAYDILTELPVMIYWPFTECRQIYNQAIY